MDYQFHQVTVFAIMGVYIPAIIIYIICMIKEKGWSNRLCYGFIVTGLTLNLPNVVKNYQQYLMGHFSGLPEVISKAQLVADTVVMIIVTLVTIGCIYVKVRMSKI